LQHVTADDVWQAHSSHVAEPGTRIQFQLEAYIPSPDADSEVVAKSSPDRLFLFMNGRPVEGTQLGKELTRHFRRQFDQRRKWPFAVIALTLPVDYFDVNLAPNKRAVLMRDEETLTSYWRSYLNALYPAPASPVKPAQQTYFNTPVKSTPLAHTVINQGHYIEDDDFVASPAKPKTPVNIDQLPGFQSAAELHRASKRARESSDEDDEPAAKKAKTSEGPEERVVEEIECVEDAARPQVIVSGADWLNCHVLGQIPQSRGLWLVAVKRTLVVCDVTRLQHAVYYQRLMQHHKLAPRIELKQPVLITAEEIEASDTSIDERQLAACLKLLHTPDEDDEQILVLNGIQLYAEDEQAAIVALAEELQPMTARELVPLLKLMVQRKSVSDEARKRLPVPRLPATAKRFKELAEQKVKEESAHKIELTREQVKELIVELCDPDTAAVSIEAVLTPDHRIVFYALAALTAGS
jgi:DNA mismatch repair ATPase MutL